MRRLIFLDVDGVLNRRCSWWRNSIRRPRGSHIDPECVRVLNDLIERSGAEIVLSSSWRLGKSRMECVSMLRKFGVRGRLAGMTPRLHHLQRGDEIAAYL